MCSLLSPLETILREKLGETTQHINDTSPCDTWRCATANRDQPMVVVKDGTHDPTEHMKSLLVTATTSDRTTSELHSQSVQVVVRLRIAQRCRFQSALRSSVPLRSQKSGTSTKKRGYNGTSPDKASLSQQIVRDGSDTIVFVGMFMVVKQCQAYFF